MLAVEPRYAHSLPGRPRAEWEPLARHLEDVGRRAGEFAARFGWAALAEAAGRLHDIGKTSAAYQDYIGSPRSDGRKGPDHSTAGAKEAENLYGCLYGRFISYAVAGHHAGLADFAELDRRVREKHLEDYTSWEAHAGSLPPLPSLAPTKRFSNNPHAGFSQAFLTRMLFSCLVDADFLATERFYDGAERPKPTDLAILQGELHAYLAELRRSAEKTRNTPLNRLRSKVLDHAVGKAALAPGLFTLTVPTGGGKTFTSLAFALEHARRHGLDRVIYVIPYTSIIEQTAAEFRKAFGTSDDVLEHHTSFDWEPARQTTESADDEGREGLAKLRKAAENWDAPVVVTTAVQFFESLFARRTSQCRKLHNIARAVVVLDEAQTLPLRLLRPCMAALNELAVNYGTSVVLCTATQPALRLCDGFKDENPAPRAPLKKVGFAIDRDRELAPDPEGLYVALKRVEVERRPDKTTDTEIIERFADQPRMLCIVNTRAHARKLFDDLINDPRTSEGARHLTTLMCPVHRRKVLTDVKCRLKAGLPVRLAATSLIEAGVDVSFPEVWRAVAGLDQIAQAAGRCNREGELEIGHTVVFDPAERKPPPDMVRSIECAESVIRNGLDPLSMKGVRAFFQELYWRVKDMDAATLDGLPWPIMEKLAERFDGKTGESTFDFETIARVFRMIDDPQETVIVPYDDEARAVLARVGAMDRPLASDLRKLQQYAVSIPRRDQCAWLTAGVLRAVNPRLGDALLRFEDRSHYRDDTGVDLRQPDRRDPTSNIC